MVTVICQHSGIEFEAHSKQTKQHPLVAELKKESNKKGTYRQVNEALDKVRAEGGYTTIEEYVQRVRQALDEIERGRETVLAEQEAAEQKNAQKRQQEATEEQIISEFDRKAADLTRGLTRCVRPVYGTFARGEIILQMGNRHVMRGTVNGVDVVVTVTGSGYDDDGYTTFYCANPAEAGLTPDSGETEQRRFF